MKRFKKWILAVAVFALALGISGMISVKAEEESKLAFDPSTNQLEIQLPSTVSGSAIIQLTETKTNGKKAVLGSYEVVKDEGKAYIDISAYAKKGIVLNVSHEGISLGDITIEKNIDKVTAKLVDLDNADARKWFEIKVGSTTVAFDSDGKINLTGGELKYRIEGSLDWQEYTNESLRDDIAVIEQFGSTIYFKFFTSDTSNKFATAEGKLKYPKLGNAIKVTIDYVKNTITFPKNVQVKALTVTGSTVDYSGTSKWENYTNATTIIGKSALKDDLSNYASGIFYARSAANDKKPATSILTVNISEMQNVPNVSTATVDSKNAKKITITGMPTNTLEYLKGTAWIKIPTTGTITLDNDSTASIKVRVQGVKPSGNELGKRCSDEVTVTISRPTPTPTPTT